MSHSFLATGRIIFIDVMADRFVMDSSSLLLLTISVNTSLSPDLFCATSRGVRYFFLFLSLQRPVDAGLTTELLGATHVLFKVFECRCILLFRSLTWLVTDHLDFLSVLTHSAAVCVSNNGRSGGEVPDRSSRLNCV